MGTLRSESWGVYGGSNLVDIMSGLYDLITLDFFTVIKPRFMENSDVLCKIVLLMCGSQNTEPCDLFPCKNPNLPNSKKITSYHDKIWFSLCCLMTPAFSMY